MMNIKYCVLEPMGNETLLVTSAVPADNKPSVTEKLLKAEKTAEQLGYFSKSGNRLTVRMSGNEFCGNAAMSAASLAAMSEQLSSAQYCVFFEGADISVSVKAEKEADNIFNCSVVMPPPVFIGECEYNFEGKSYILPTVKYNSISHIICLEDIPQSVAERAIVKWCDGMNEAALGLMFFDEQNKTLKPLVYVSGSKTLFWESSCASGTSAVGEYCFNKYNRAVDLTLKEPAGTLRAVKNRENGLMLYGNVTVKEFKNIIV